MSTHYEYTIPPSFPVRALIPRPDTKLPKQCSNTIWSGLLCAPLQWFQALISLYPFPKRNDGCRHCADCKFTYHVGKAVRLANQLGTGTITMVNHFQNDEVIFKVEGPDVRAMGNVAYVVAPRNKASLSFIDELRFRLTPSDDKVFRGDYIWVERENLGFLTTPRKSADHSQRKHTNDL